jgi:hypothetical protein
MLEKRKKRGGIPSFANSIGQTIGKAGLSSPAFPALPKALGLAIGKDGLPMKHAPSFANSLGQSCWQS